MRSRPLLVVCLLLLTFGGLFAYPHLKFITGPESHGDDHVRLTLPGSVEDVRRNLQGVFAAGTENPDPLANAGLPAPFSALWTVPCPSSDQIAQHTDKNPELKSYAALPARAHPLDMCLNEPTGDVLWPSEYRYFGRPAEFRCMFILHLTPGRKSETTLEILEYLPSIRVGRRFGWSAHTGPLPGFFMDWRLVGPTWGDREQLSALIRARLTAEKT